MQKQPRSSLREKNGKFFNVLLVTELKKKIGKERHRQATSTFTQVFKVVTLFHYLSLKMGGVFIKMYFPNS